MRARGQYDMDIKSAASGRYVRRRRAVRRQLAAAALDALCRATVVEFGGKPKELNVSVIDKLKLVAERRAAMTKKLGDTADKLLAKYDELDGSLDEAEHQHVQRMAAETAAVDEMADAVKAISNMPEDDATGKTPDGVAKLGNSQGAPGSAGGH